MTLGRPASDDPSRWAVRNAEAFAFNSLMTTRRAPRKSRHSSKAARPVSPMSAEIKAMTAVAQTGTSAIRLALALAVMPASIGPNFARLQTAVHVCVSDSLRPAVNDAVVGCGTPLIYSSRVAAALVVPETVDLGGS